MGWENPLNLPLYWAPASGAGCAKRKPVGSNLLSTGSKTCYFNGLRAVAKIAPPSTLIANGWVLVQGGFTSGKHKGPAAVPPTSICRKQPGQLIPQGVFGQNLGCFGGKGAQFLSRPPLKLFTPLENRS